MVSNSIIRWGIVGGGKVVESKSGPGFNIAGQSTVSAVVRRNIDDARHTAATLGASRCYSDIEHLLSDSSVDAIYLATPPGLHYAQAVQCINAGIPVYIEKPFATNYRDAKQLVELSEERMVPIFVAQYRRAIKRFQYVREILQKGEIGQPLEFDFRLSRKLEDNVSHPWLYNIALSGGGKFADIAPHSIDILTYFFGDVVFVGASARHVKSPNGREDIVTGALRCTSGVLGTINYNFVALSKEDQLTINCEHGTIHMSIHGNRDVEIYYRDGRQCSLQLPLPSIIEAPMIQEVVSFLRGSGGNPCLGKDALESVRIIEKILMTLE